MNKTTIGNHLASSFALTKILIKIFLRDRQAIFFSIFFPFIFIFALGTQVGHQPASTRVGIIDNAHTELSASFIKHLNTHKELSVSADTEDALNALLEQRKLSAIIIIPSSFNAEQIGDINILVDSSHLGATRDALAVIQPVLDAIERKMQNIDTLFEVAVEDIQAHPIRYIDFLLPGILAFSLMQISVAGSAFNVVEYRRKGILKRLFVTPLKPGHFVAGLVAARMGISIVQVGLLIALSVLLLDVTVSGSLLSLLLVVILGASTFLCLGFSLGSFAKSQQSIQALGNLFIFPQMFLSGIFYPLESLPSALQAVSAFLPLTFIADAMRRITTEAAGLFQLGPDLIGLMVWALVSFALAARFFKWKQIAQ